MTTAPDENNKLLNNKHQIFKFNNDNTLELQGLNIISRKEDGYINLNQLCKAGGKEFYEWKKNKKSLAFLQVLNSSRRILRDELIKYNSGSNEERANWGHPQVAINVAQWISPEFDVKVSKWIFELMLTGSVSLGKEKSQKTLELEFKKQINSLESQLTLQTEQTQLKQNALQHITQKHTKLLKKRSYYKFKKGECFYVWNDPDSKVVKYKVGFTTNINQRLSQERTSVPELHLVYLVYLPQAQLLESMVLEKFREYRMPQNHELVKLNHNTIIKITQTLLKYFKFNCTEENDLHKYNNEDNPNNPNTPNENTEINLLFIDEKKNEDMINKRICIKCQEKKEINDNFKKSGAGYSKTCTECINNPIVRQCKICKKEKILNGVNFQALAKGFKYECKECIIERYTPDVDYRIPVKNIIDDEIGTKKCCGCCTTLSKLDFCKSSKASDGLNSICKNCDHDRKYGPKSRLIKIPPKNIPQDKKWCPKCEKIKLKISYYKAKNRPDGLQHSCKDCNNKIRVRNGVLKNVK